VRIFIANLPFTVSESELKAGFEQWGDVERVTIMRDAMRESRGFGFVDMIHDRDALLAIQELDGKDWDGRRIHVEEARPARNAGSASPVTMLR
jgi:RNA recognition motif-containing protein